jgi:hypothetical protein
MNLSGDKNFLSRIEKASGIVYRKKTGYTLPTALAGEPKALPSGYKVVHHQLGSTNSRYYVYDPRGRYVGFLYTEKGVLQMPDATAWGKQRKLLMEIGREFFPDGKDGTPEAFGRAGVYYSGGQWTDENGLKPKPNVTTKLQWVAPRRGDGRLYLAFLGKKRVLRIETDVAQGSWGNAARKYIADIKVLDPAVFKHIEEIKSYATEKMGIVDDHHWTQIGLLPVSVKSGWRNSYEMRNLCQRKVGEFRHVSIWTGDGRVALLTPEGMIGQATLLKNGKLKIGRDYRYGEKKVLADRIFEMIETYRERTKDYNLDKLKLTGGDEE